MGEYNPKSKGLQTSWKGMQRRLPKRLSTFHIVVLAGFLSLLILRSTIGFASLGFGGGSTTTDDGTDGEPKRNLVQTGNSDVSAKFPKKAEKYTEEELQDGLDEQIAEQQLAEVRKAMGKDVKNVKEEKPVEVVEEQPIPKLKQPVVEDFEQVEAQLAEEETADEVAAFEKSRKGGMEKETVSTTKPKSVTSDKAKDPKLATPETKAQMLTLFQKATEIEISAVQEAEDEMAAYEQKFDLRKAVDRSKKRGEATNAVEEDPTIEKRPPMTPAQLEALKKEAMANMSKITRRDHPNAFTFGPSIKGWDAQRAAWLEKHPHMKSTDPHKPKVLLVSGSQPWPCDSPVGDHYLLKMIKNKVDYARIHKIETFYSFAHLDKSMSHFWAKLPIVRKMMLTRPEMEWIFWMDSDAVFTDMVFEIPFEKYQDYNLVMWGYPEGVYGERSWVACNTGVMFLRNNQWTLDLLEEWSHMGPEGEIRNEAGRIMTSYLTNRPTLMADDQSALVYMLVTRPELRPYIGLEDDFLLSGYWVGIVGNYEEYLETSKPGDGGKDWPFTTHFTGCQPCSGQNNQMYGGNSCLDGMERAFNFADNQVLQSFGFEHESLYGQKVHRIRNETAKPIWSVPVDNPWAVKSYYT